MEKKQDISPVGSHGKVWMIASLFILSGILLFTRNMGWITDELFHVVVSWYSLFIVLGIYAIVRRYYLRGVILLLIGVYFLLGGLSCLPENSQAMIWPLALVLTGVFFLIKNRRKEQWRRRYRFARHMHRTPGRMDMKISEEQPGGSVDGFLYSDNTYNTVRHVVLDDLFKGASIRTLFGGTVIDLRHTHLAPGETFIDLDCNFGGVELYVPSNWKVVVKCDTFFGGYEDKRWQERDVDQERTLVIWGRISCGGMEIKD